LGSSSDLYFDAINQQVSARIDRIAPDVDGVSQTVRMRAVIEDAAQAIPVGMPGMVRPGTDGQTR